MPSANTGPESSRGWLPVFGALLLALAAFLVADLRARPRAAFRYPAAESFHTYEALSALERVIGGVGPHPAGTLAHELVRERLLGELRDLGLVPVVEEGFALGPYGYAAVARNVLVRIPGQDDERGPKRSVLLMAHYDSEGQAIGAADDGSGVAILLECARKLIAAPAPRPVILLFTDAEEAGLVGAVAFCEQSAWFDEVAVVVNAEARGTSGPSRMFQTYGANRWLIEAYARACRRSRPGGRPHASSVSDLVYKSMPNDTDLTVLGEHGVPGLNFAFIRGLARYHTPKDDLAHLSLASLQEQGENVLGLAYTLGEALARTKEPTGTPDVAGEVAPGVTGDVAASLALPAAGSVVYSDVLSFDILAWPTGWSLGLAGLALALAVLGTALALRSRAIGAGALLAGLAACALGPGLGVLATWVWLRTASETSGVLDPSAASPWPWTLGLLALNAAAALVAHGFTTRISGLAGAWIAAWLAASIGAVVTALRVPEASYLLILPALAAGAVALPCGMLRPLPPGAPAGVGRTLACCLTFAVAAAFWLPLLIGLQHGFGFRPDLVNAACLAGPLGVVALALAPLFALGRWLPLFSATALAATVWLGATGFGLALPAHTPDAPAWLNVRYILNADSGAARWDVSTFGAEAPPELVAAAGLAPATEPPFPWLSFDRSLFVGRAPLWDVAPPTFEVTAVERAEGGRVVRGHVRSPRGTSRLHLRLPDGVDLVAATWNGHEIRDRFQKRHGHIFCAIPPEDGLAVELFARGAEPFDVWILDEDWTLPPEARAILAARPAYAVPRGDGDVSIVGRSVRVE